MTQRQPFSGVTRSMAVLYRRAAPIIFIGLDNIHQRRGVTTQLNENPAGLRNNSNCSCRSSCCSISPGRDNGTAERKVVEILMQWVSA